VTVSVHPHSHWLVDPHAADEKQKIIEKVQAIAIDLGGAEKPM